MVHGALGKDADLDAIAERIVAVGGVDIRLMPRDEVGIGTPIGFFSVEASSYLWIRFFAGAKIDVRAFEALYAPLCHSIDFAKNQQLIGS